MGVNWHGLAMINRTTKSYKNEVLKQLSNRIFLTNIKIIFKTV